MRTNWKPGSPKIVYYLVKDNNLEIKRLEQELEVLVEKKNNLVKECKYEEAAYVRNDEKIIMSILETLKSRPSSYVGPYQNKPSERLCKSTGSRIAKFSISEII